MMKTRFLEWFYRHPEWGRREGWKWVVRVVIGLVLTVMAALLLSSCAPDPRNQADADAKTLASQTAAAQAELEREIQRAEFERTQALWEAVKGMLFEVAALLVKWVGITAVVSICYVVAYVARAIRTMAEGFAQAANVYALAKAEVLGNSIALDPRTRQFPVFRQALPRPANANEPWAYSLGQRRYVLVNPNDSSVEMLDMAHEADRQKIAAAGAVQFVGAWSQEVRRSKDGEIAAGAGAIQPVVISANDKPNGLEVGQFMEMVREMLRAGSEER